MSFSSNVRRELCDLFSANTCCPLSELSAIINTCGKIDGAGVFIGTESEPAAVHYNNLLKQAFGKEGVLKRRGQLYTVETEFTDAVLSEISVPPAANCCKRAYIRGSFIAGGTVSDPLKTYHIEFSLALPAAARRLSLLLRGFGLHPKTAGRKHHTLVYVKESEEIVDLLNIMEAHKALLELENVRIVKEMRNSVNRRVNFETANLKKTVNAAVGQLEDIQFIEKTAGLGYLSKTLEETARLRIEYESASLKEIGAMMDPAVGKSGVNHRLRKISETAENLRKELKTND